MAGRPHGGICCGLRSCVLAGVNNHLNNQRKLAKAHIIGWNGWLRTRFLPIAEGQTTGTLLERARWGALT